MQIAGYEVLQEIVRDDCLALWRARRTTDGLTVLLRAPLRRSSGSELIENEYQVLLELSLPGVPRVLEFLKTLHQEAWLRFEDAAGRWTARSHAVEAAITHNVADLMTRKTRRLGPGTQRTLMLATCIGAGNAVQAAR
jgi:hypothetical protein